MLAAAVEVGAFIEWLFTGNSLCGIGAKEWKKAFGRAFSWGGFSGIDVTVATFESISNAIMCILCSAQWLYFEIVWPMWNVAGTVIGMIVEKCKVLGGGNPSIEFCFSLNWTIQRPSRIIQKAYSFSIGWCNAITSYYEKQCYVFICIGAKFSLPFPTAFYNADNETWFQKNKQKIEEAAFSFNICLCGSPTKDGFVNLWMLHGRLKWVDPAGGPKEMSIQCGFFYVRYWFRFNAISVKASAGPQDPDEIQEAKEITLGLSITKVWVPFCVMAHVTESCRMYYTGEEFNIGNQWDSYISNHGHLFGQDNKNGNDSMKGFRGYE